jgi:cysteate synthase
LPKYLKQTMATSWQGTNYKLQSQASGALFDDSGWVLEAPGEDPTTLVRAVYENRQLTLLGKEYGFYTFASWLPVKRMLQGSSAPVTYKSEGLAKALNLSNLYITFSGWWPERGARNRTCSFKETEAYAVCGRLDPSEKKVLVVASAGNTARAFARVCSDNKIPLLLCIPEDCLGAMWFDEPVDDCVKLAATRSGSDYFDAINLSNLAVKCQGFIPEGGAKNVARRDGMGTTFLSATTFIGRIPDYYFQAIGSGTGAIAAWEANLRLIADGRFGQNKAKLLLSQNAPFHPMYDAWKAGSRVILPMNDNEARHKVEAIIAKVLSNRRPPYPPAGGLFDALCDAGGDILLASNEEAVEAARLFEKTEGIDIHPAAAVAMATLIKAVSDGSIDKNAVIMLNITGGGEERFKGEHQLYYLQPSVVFNINPALAEVDGKLKALFAC